MRRGQPPERRTPLRRSLKPLKRTALRVSSKPIPKRSQKRLEQLGAEIEFRNACAARVGCEAHGLHATPGVPVCQKWRPHLGVHAHHVLPRGRGGKHDAETNGLWLCAASHEWAHQNPNAARVLGLLR